MIQSTYSVIILVPSEGYTLTQSAEVEIKDRILSKKVCLGINDSTSNWKEITDAEADEIKLEQEKYIEEQKELLRKEQENKE